MTVYPNLLATNEPMNDQEILLALARELQHHFTSFVEAFHDLFDESEAWKKDESEKRAEQHLENYNDARRRLRLTVGQASVLHLPGAEHKRERWFLQQVLLEEAPLDKLFRSLGQRNSLHFSEEELNPIVEEYLSWFSYLDYAQAKLEGAVLVVNAGELPPDLMHFVTEIQECYAFQRYTAVYALCRTALEAGLLPVYRANQLAHPDSRNSQYVRKRIEGTKMKSEKKKRLTAYSQLYSNLTLDDFSPSLEQMITRLCWLSNYSKAKVGDELLRSLLHDIRDRGNSMIHANMTANRQSARQMMIDLFQALHALHEVESQSDDL